MIGSGAGERRGHVISSLGRSDTRGQSCHLDKPAFLRETSKVTASDSDSFGNRSDKPNRFESQRQFEQRAKHKYDRTEPARLKIP